MKQEIQLSEHFTFRKLLRFTLPSIVMMVFTSIYGVVDGIFVSNFVGKTPFAAVNFIMPFLMILGAFGFMIGTGGSALVAKTIGEGHRRLAHRLFSMLVYISLVFGVVLAVVGIVFIDEIAVWLGADEAMLGDCVVYGRIILLALPAFILQNIFQPFLVAAEKPSLGLAVTVAAGLTNIVLDYLFIVVFRWGVSGAAIATVISQCVGGLLPLLYFMLPNKSLLRLTASRFYGREFLKVCVNGSSELVTQVSVSLVAMLYNFQLMRYIGEDGVAAFGVIMYVNFIFLSVFIGYSIGSAPIISYNYGAKNHDELRNVFRKSLYLVSIMALILTVAAELSATPLARIFVGYDAALYALTRRAFMIYSVAFLLVGFNIYASAFFTALNNGVVSAVISFSRTLLFEACAVLLLPLLLGIDGIWLAVACTEVLALIVSVTFLCYLRPRYRY